MTVTKLQLIYSESIVSQLSMWKHSLTIMKITLPKYFHFKNDFSSGREEFFSLCFEPFETFTFNDFIS